MNDATFLILFLSLTALMGLVPFLFKRFGIPSIISLLVVGMLIGPTGVGVNLVPWLAERVAFLAPPGSSPAHTAEIFQSFIDQLGSLGLMFLMALAGMEADFKLLGTCRRPVFFLSTLTFLLPALGGFWLYRHYFPDQLSGQLLYASLFASHSVGIVFPVVRELRLAKSRFGASVLIATVITDIASILLLAVAVQLFRQNTDSAHMVLNETMSILDHRAGFLGNSFMYVFIAVVLVYVAAVLFGVHRLAKWIVSRLNPGEDLMITLILLVVLAASLVGELFGINFIVGSFIAGLGLSRVVRQQDMLLFRRVESIGYGFLIPFLFISIGMQTNLRVIFNSPGNLTIILLTVVGLVGSKVFSGWLAMRFSGYGNAEGLCAGVMTVPQLSATLAAAAVGKSLGMLDENFFNAIVVLSIITTLPVPNIVRWLIERNHLTFPSSTEEVYEFKEDQDELV